MGTTLATATMLPLVPLSSPAYIMPATPVRTLKPSGTRDSTMALVRYVRGAGMEMITKDEATTVLGRVHAVFAKRSDR